MKKIKSLLQEAEVYRVQGLLQEAMQKYKTASELIMKTNQIKSKQNLIHVISKKMRALENDFDKSKKKQASQKMSKKSQDLVKSMFSFSKGMGKDEAALEGAIALAKFGQYKRALSEFNNLLTIDSIRLDAAKNIIRCYMALSSPDKSIDQFKEWISRNLLNSDQLKKIHFFLENSLKKSGIKRVLPEIKESDLSDYTEFEEEEEDVLDISSIGIIVDRGPQKGKVVELDVSFQTGNIINVITSSKERMLIEILRVGFRINDIQFYSPIAIFKGSGIVSAMTRINSGPKKGDYSLDIKVISP